MTFDVNAFREAHRPWAFTVGARTYGARHVSAPTVLKYEQLRTAAKTPRQMERALWWILRRAFPWRPSYALRGDPVKILMRELEPPARAEALKAFFACLRGNQTSAPQPKPKTSGTRSPEPTPPQAA